MFEYVGDVPADWEPIPDAELASLPPLPDDDLPPGVTGEYVDSCDRLIDRAVAMGPCGTALTLLTSVPAAMLSEQAQAAALAQLTGLQAHVAAAANEFTASLAGPAAESVTEKNDNFASHDVGVALRASVYAADNAIALARDLATVLRATRDAMRRGEVTAAQARALHHATLGLPADVARAIEARVLKRASIQSTRNFAKSVDRAGAALDPHWTKTAKAARAEVEVTHTAFGDGVGQLYIRGPLEATTALSMAMNAYAAKTKDKLGGTAAQRKLAGLRDFAEDYLYCGAAPKNHGRLPAVGVVVGLDAMLGRNDHPAEIPGVGPVPADVARWLIADGAPIRRLLIEPTTGHLLDYGQSTYLVPPRLADVLIAKNVMSASPHSTVDARMADMEHNLPHDQGGPTNPINVTPVDRRWHRAKTHGNWTYEKQPDGIIVWTSPNGLTCQIEPHDYRCGP
jgi:Domain of unknown function (DUF222)